MIFGKNEFKFRQKLSRMKQKNIYPLLYRINGEHHAAKRTKTLSSQMQKTTIG